MRLIGRIIWVAIASLLAAAAGMAFMLLFGLEWLTAFLAAKGSDGVERWIDSAGFIVPQFGRLLELQAAWWALFVPAFAVLVVAETVRIRSLTYYLAGGGIAFATLPLLMHWAETADTTHTSQDHWQSPVLLLTATAGFVAGAIYWLLAGRRA